jgi:hypothetical protein
MVADDNDSLERLLKPSERRVYEWIKLHPDQPFSSKDIIDLPEKYAAGTARNIILRLKQLKLIKLYSRDFLAFYILATSNPGMIKKPVTLSPMGDKGPRRVQIDVGALLDSLPWEELCKIHDVHLNFLADGLYQLFLDKDTFALDAVSGDISFGSIDWSKYRSLKVILHRTGSVSFYLGCSNCPIQVSVEGFLRLASFLGGARNELLATAKAISPLFSQETLPEVTDWTVVLWHYGRDSAQEFSGASFNVTFKMWCGELARIYLHHYEQSSRVRLEVVQRPEKPLQQAIAEKLNLCCGRCKGC